MTVQTLSFLHLPSEIRLQIYSYLFCPSHISIKGPTTPSPYCSPSFLCNGRSICACSFRYAIALTCKKLQDEALPYLLRETTVQLLNSPQKTQLLPSMYLTGIRRVVMTNTEAFCSSSATAARCPVSRLKEWVEWDPAEYFQDLFPNLQVLELRRIAVWCKFHDEDYLVNEASDEDLFWMAMFNLKRMSGGLFRLCYDGHTACAPETTGNNMSSNLAHRSTAGEKGRGRRFRILLYCHFVVSSLTHQTVHAAIDVDQRKVLRKMKGPSHSDRNTWAGFY